MSMNLTLSATYLRKGRSPEEVDCGLLQTPTEITYKALENNAASAKKVYLDWVATWQGSDPIVPEQKKLIENFLRRHRAHAKWGLR